MFVTSFFLNFFWLYTNILRQLCQGSFIFSTDQSAMILPNLEVLKLSTHWELLSHWSISCKDEWKVPWHGSIRDVVRCYPKNNF